MVSVRQGGCRCELGQQQQRQSDDRKRPHMGVLQNFPPAFQAPAGLHRIGDVHESVQVDKAGGKIGIGRHHQSRHQPGQMQHADQPGQNCPHRTDFQPHQGQEGQHFLPCLFFPHRPGPWEGAEHTLAHDKCLKIQFHGLHAPLYTVTCPALTSATTSQTRANRRSI